MTRLNYNFTGISEIATDIITENPDLPIIIRTLQSLGKGRSIPISNVVIEEVTHYSQEDKVLIKSQDLEYFEVLVREYVTTLGDSITDEEAKKLLYTWQIYKNYQELHWERAIVIYIGG